MKFKYLKVKYFIVHPYTQQSFLQKPNIFADFRFRFSPEQILR